MTGTWGRIRAELIQIGREIRADLRYYLGLPPRTDEKEPR